MYRRDRQMPGWPASPPKPGFRFSPCTGALTRTACPPPPPTTMWRAGGVGVEALVQGGVARKRIILDPGLGFAKRIEQNWEILNRLNVIVQFGLPLLVGASRKSFLGVLLPPDASLNERDALTATVSVLASQAGAWGVRVHNVQATVRALDVWAAWQRGGMGDVGVFESLWGQWWRGRGSTGDGGRGSHLSHRAAGVPPSRGVCDRARGGPGVCYLRRCVRLS